MAVTFFTSRIKRVLSAVVSVALVFTQTLPLSAHATTFTCNASLADAGQDPRCAAVRIGGVPVAYPKLQWEKISEVPLASKAGSTEIAGGSQAMTLANRTALALGLSPSDIANVNTTFPANVPYVFARYNPIDLTLRIDLFKLDKQVDTSGAKAYMMHATFTPAHGDHWKANRSYIHPDAYTAGTTPGLNPFSAFLQSGSNEFHNISLAGAQVAVGHAMRMSAAPLGLLAVSETRFSQVTTKSGGLFKKTVRTWTYGHAKPRWMIAQPTDVLSRSTTPAFAAFCANDPNIEECPRYQTAVSGVSFEEFTGGTLLEEEEKWEVDFQKKSGLSFLGALVLGVLGSFAISALMASAGISLGATGAASAVGGASSGTALGSFGSFLTTQGVITGVTGLGQAIAIEAAYVALSMAVVGGANLSSVIAVSPGVLLGSVRVHKGLQSPQELSRIQAKLNTEVSSRVKGEFHKGGPDSGSALKGFNRTVMGDCEVGKKLSECSASANGMVPRVDQYSEQNRVEFTKETNGSVVRDAKPTGPR